MRILFDIGHPAHVHLFKNLARLLMAEGATVLFTARDKEFELDLLKAEGFEYINFGKHYRSLPGKIWGLLRYDLKMVQVGLKFKPDLLVSHGTMYAAHAAPLLGAKYLAIEDTGNMEQVVIYRPFTDVILTPEVMNKDLGPKQINYNGYHELAYLHPEFYQPDPEIHNWLGVEEGEPYAIIRFISWNATHDVGHEGMTTEDKVELVRKLSKKMKVFITSERAVTDDLQPFCLRIPPDKFHHALHYASIVISEGTTTATEAGILGTPCVYISTLADPMCEEMEEFGLVFNTSRSKDVFAMVDRVLAEDREVYRQRGETFVASKENVTRYYFDFIMQRYFGKKLEEALP